MIRLTRSRLEELRDQLRAHGQRPSLVLPTSRSALDLMEAKEMVQKWGAFVEAMYLMMAADRRVLNVEREVLRGALAILSEDTLRTRHMESMLDFAARKYAEEGAEKRLQKVIEAIRKDRARAELTVVLAAAIAAADDRIVPEEHELLNRLFKGLGIDEVRANELLQEVQESVAAKPAPNAQP